MEDFEKRGIKYSLLIIATTAICMMLCFLFMFKCVPTTNACNNEHIISNNKLVEIKREIVAEIDSYMNLIAPTNKVNAEVFFNLCDQYNVDVRFVLAQGQVESHFATKGTAKKTNSIFNVGAYDGHSAKKQMRNGFGYKDPNDSIEPYLILLTNNYLIDGKTENDLMHNFVNHLGMRYASNKRYERMLQNVYARINNNTNLDILIAEYNKYKKLLC